MTISDSVASCYSDSSTFACPYHVYDGSTYDVSIHDSLTYPLYFQKVNLNTGDVSWKTKIDCTESTCSALFAVSKIDETLGRVYNLVTHGQGSVIRVFWVVLDYTTGEVVGNRYLAGLTDIIGSTNMEDVGGLVYIITNGNSLSSYLSKYNKSFDKIETTMKHTSIFSNVIKTPTALLFTGKFDSNK